MAELWTSWQTRCTFCTNGSNPKLNQLPKTINYVNPSLRLAQVFHLILFSINKKEKKIVNLWYKCGLYWRRDIIDGHDLENPLGQGAYLHFPKKNIWFLAVFVCLFKLLTLKAEPECEKNNNNKKIQLHRNNQIIFFLDYHFHIYLDSLIPTNPISNYHVKNLSSFYTKIKNTNSFLIKQTAWKVLESFG